MGWRETEKKEAAGTAAGALPFYYLHSLVLFPMMLKSFVAIFPSFFGEGSDPEC